ncbi:Hypothetical predicted protein [Paramuricea clavata]|nr:Hypothetical predicted protein [Paramuricea clavata]
MKIQLFLGLTFIALALGGNEETSNVKGLIVENEQDETSSMLELKHDGEGKDPGYCQWGVGVTHKPGYIVRCSCMKCTCLKIGKWDCVYYFPYCPFYYCGNQVYDPLKQVCCCGKRYNKQHHHNCCGYQYYDTKISKCCNYFSVKAKKDQCPRDKI